MTLAASFVTLDFSFFEANKRGFEFEREIGNDRYRVPEIGTSGRLYRNEHDFSQETGISGVAAL